MVAGLGEFYRFRTNFSISCISLVNISIVCLISIIIPGVYTIYFTILTIIFKKFLYDVS